MGLYTADPAANVVQGRLEARHIPGSGARFDLIDGILADESVPGGVVGEVAVHTELALDQLLLPAKATKLVVQLKQAALRACHPAHPRSIHRSQGA